MKLTKPLSIVIITLLVQFAAMPQAVPAAKPAEPSPGTPPTVLPPDETGIPRGFRGIELGMGLEEVQKLLTGDGMFVYRGEPDVSLLPRPNETLIEVAGISYVKRAFFQFYEGKLFVMIFAMNEKKIDHYSIFTEMSKKYGKPDSLTPSESIWLDAASRVSIERPLAVKYIDLETFNKLKEAGQAEQSYEEVLRSEFLNGF